MHVPLGNYLARVYSTTGDCRLERAVYRVVGVRPGAQQRWTGYLGSLLAFSAVSVLFLYAVLLLQQYLPEPWGRKGISPALAFNTAISFTTNTSWQNYPGETTLGHVGLLTGLGVQAFASCAVGMCVAVALIRGLTRTGGELGNFWVDLVRTLFRALLPLSCAVSIALLASGVIANFHGVQEFTTTTGGYQSYHGRSGRPLGVDQTGPTTASPVSVVGCC